MWTPRRRILVVALALVALTTCWFLFSSLRRTAELRSEAANLAAASGLTPSRLPEHWIDWLLTVEDPAFHSHRGVDVKTPGAGWTTVTQALVKLHFPGPNRGPVGKVLQSLRALVLDANLSKQDQLTLLLNTAYFGDSSGGPVYGFPNAARSVYAAELDQLTDAQFLGLVAMLVGPNTFHPVRAPHAHQARLHRLQNLVFRRCRPTSWRDVYLSACDRP